MVEVERQQDGLGLDASGSSAVALDEGSIVPPVPVGEGGQWPDAVKQRVIDLYLAGVPTADITRQTEVQRSSIYFILKKAGIRPRRRGRPRLGGGMTQADASSDPGLKAMPSAADPDQLIAYLLERNAALERQIGEYRARLNLSRMLLDDVDGD